MGAKSKGLRAKSGGIGDWLFYFLLTTKYLLTESNALGKEAVAW
jgi:hypothetical protein